MIKKLLLAAVFLVILFIAVCYIAGLAPSEGTPRICFASEESRNPEIYSMYLDGAGRTRLTFTPNGADSVQPSVSPDGANIAFISNRDGTDNVYVMDKDGKNTRRITNLVYPYAAISPVWGPDGETLAYIKAVNKRDSFGRPLSLEIFTYGLKDNKEKQLTSGWELGPNRIDWQRKENKLVFVTGKWGNVNSGFILNPLDTSKAQPLTPATPVGYFSFSPDSANKLACAGSLNDGGNDSLDIYIIELKDQKVSFKRLTSSDHPFNCRQPAWSPDGKNILFTSNKSGAEQIYVMDVNGKNRKKISAVKTNEYDPAWFPAEAKK